MLQTVQQVPYHGAKSYQPNQSILGKQTQTHHQRFFEGGQTVLFLTGIHDIEEYGRAWCRSRKLVFDGSIAGVKLRWDRIRGDVFVVRRKRVSRQAERTNPKPGADIHLARQDQLRFVNYVLGRSHLTSRGSGLIDKVACRLQARIVAEECQASPSEEYRVRRLVPRAWRLPTEYQ